MTQTEYIKEVATRLLKRYPAFEQTALKLNADKIIELISNPEATKLKYGNGVYKVIDKVGSAVEHFNQNKTVDQSVSLLQGPVEHIIYNKFNSVAEQVVTLKSIAKAAIEEKIEEKVNKKIEETINIENYFDYE